MSLPSEDRDSPRNTVAPAAGIERSTAASTAHLDPREPLPSLATGGAELPAASIATDASPLEYADGGVAAEYEPVGVRDRVWWSDIDKMGVMYFARYIRFAERAESEFFRTLGFSYDELHARFGVWLARIHLDVEFRHPAKLDDELVAWAQLARVTATSMHFRFPVDRAHDARRLADIALVVVCLDAATLKPVRIPGPLEHALRSRLMPDDSA